MTDLRDTSEGRRWHDMGGLDAGPVETDAAHDFALWEKRVDALVILCGKAGIFTVDGLRRALEDMGPAAFEEMSYYDRWVRALVENLLESGVITVDELDRRMTEVAARGPTYGEAQGGTP